VEGDVIDAATSAPLSGARAKLEHGQDVDPVFGKVDQQGHFVFRNLDPGFYTLVVDAPGFHQSRASIDASAPRPVKNGGAVRGVLGGVISGYPQSQIPQAKVSKAVDDDGTIHATVSAPMQAYASIVGKVTDPYGAPLAGAGIEILKPRPAAPNGAPPPASAQTVTVFHSMMTADSGGEYRAGRLEPGTYWVVANRPHNNSQWVWQSTYRVTYFPAALDVTAAQSLKIEAGQQVRADIQILRQAGVSISGHLLGLPSLGGAIRSLYTTVSLLAADTEALNPERPYASGEKDFQLTDVLPGHYTLFAETYDPASDPMNGNRKPLFGLVKDVEVGKEDMAGFDLALEPLKNLSGTVELTDGCDRLPTLVQLLGPNPMMPGVVEAPIAADRSFVLQNVPAGRYKLSVSNRDQPYYRNPIASAMKGARDVLKDGVESPWPDDNSLKIKIGCTSQGVRQ
jgi:hypothetical protein